MGERQRPAPHIALGSVKSMIGHCIPAAGVASIIKLAMALDRKVLPPTLADEVNPTLGLEKTPLYLNTETLPWLHRRDAPRRAAINAFGFGGVNSHLILEEAPGTLGDPTAAFGLRHHRTAELFLLAGDTREELVAAAQSLADAAEQRAALPLRTLAMEAFQRLGAGGHRLAIVAADATSLCQKLRGIIDKVANPETHRLQSRTGVFFTDQPIGGQIAFVFPGENSQYPYMLRDLALASPAVREWLDRLEGLFHGEREVPHRILMYPPKLGLSDAERQDLEARLRGVDNGSEAVFFADIALFTLLRALGVTPDFIVGHSTGENAAIIASGLVDASPDQVCDYIRRMNAIFRTVDEGNLIPNGMLLTIGAIERAAIDRVLERHSEIQFTMDNCPNQVVLFGPAPLMTEVNAELTAQGAICTALPLSWAYHTTFVTPMVEGFSKLVGDDGIGTPFTRVYSCASAGPFPEEAPAIRELLRQQYVSRVRFTETIRRLYDDGARIFVEVGPGSTLTGFVDDILRDRPHLALASDSTRRSTLEQMLQLLGQLFVHSVPLDLAPLYAGSGEFAALEPSSQPFLESALPFIHLAPEEAARVREILQPAMPAPAPVTAEPPVQAEVHSARPMPAAARPSARSEPRPLTEHFGLMGDFLQNQEIVTHHAVQRQRGLASAPVSGWSGNLALPFAASIEFVGAPAMPAAAFAAMLAPLLGAGDLEYFEREIAPQGSHRQAEWLLGRLALRRALAAWLGGHGDPQGADREIGYDPEGRPVLNGGPTPNGGVFLSLSHKGGIAVGVASDRPVGIDLEQFTALRDPAGVLGIAFSPAEAALVANGHGPDPRLVTIAWSAKEAAAKSLGQKILLRERSFELRAFDPAQGRARLSHDGSVIDAFSAVDGDFVCTLAAAVSLQ
jgi:acyl transferase domain-containing protein/phosphopantetheinyl transferase